MEGAGRKDVVLFILSKDESTTIVMTLFCEGVVAGGGNCRAERGTLSKLDTGSINHHTRHLVLLRTLPARKEGRTGWRVCCAQRREHHRMEGRTGWRVGV